MAQTLGVKRPYSNLKNYLEYKKTGIEILKAHEQEIEAFEEVMGESTEEDSE